MTFREGTLYCDGVPMDAIARATGTPVYVYSGGAIRAAHAALDGAFQGYPHTLHFALKANSTLAVLRLIRGLGCSADANSGGEIEAARRAGFEPAQRLSFKGGMATGVGRPRLDGPGVTIAFQDVLHRAARDAKPLGDLTHG